MLYLAVDLVVEGSELALDGGHLVALVRDVLLGVLQLLAGLLVPRRLVLERDVVNARL